MSVNKTKPKSKIVQAIEARSNSVQMLIVVLAAVGAWGILAGLCMLPAALSDELTDAHELDVVFNLLFGALVFAVAAVLVKGRLLGLWLSTGILLLVSAFNYFLGREFNLLLSLFGAVIIWRMYMAQRRGELV